MKLDKVFLLAGLSFLLGDFCGLNGFMSGVFLKVGIFVFLIAMIIISVYKKKSLNSHYFIFVTFFFLIGCIIGFKANVIPEDSIAHFVGQRGVVTSEVVYNSFQHHSDDYASFVLRAKYFTTGDKTLTTSGKIKVGLSQMPAENQFKAGDVISVGGELKPLSSFYNPGSKDMVAYNNRQDIYARVVSKYDKVVIDRKNNFFGGLEKFLQMVKENMQKSMPQKDQQLLFAMIFGGYSDIDDITIDNFSTVGLVHILSVSGAHVAMIAGFSLYLLRKIGLGSKKSTVITCCCIVFYAALAGFSLPVVRAVVMCIALLVGLLLERRSNKSNIFIIICILMLIYEPRWLFDISFQLSFLAVAGIIYLSEPIKEKLSFLPNVVSSGLSITLSVQISTLPLVAYYFYQIPLLSFLANLLILPILELCLLVSLVGLFVYLVLPVIGSVLFIVASLLLGIAVRFTELLASFDLAVFFIPNMPDWFWICYYLMVMLFFSLLPIYTSFKIRKIVFASFVVIVIFLVFIGSTGNHFAVHYIDVGQGEASLIITPNKKAILIDTGVKNDYSSYDVGKYVIVPYLRHYGIHKIELLVLSHGHSDHAGGAAAIARQISIAQIWLPNEKTSDAVERLLLVAGGKNKTMYNNQEIVIDDVKVKVIYAADLGYLPQKKNNETSAVVEVEYLGKIFLFTGDATREIEMKVEPLLGKIDVLSVSHHGSSSSSGESFIKKIKPDISVISAASNNRYGHPSLKTLKTLYKNGSQVARTDKDGAIVVRFEKDDLVWYGYKKSPMSF